MKMLISLQNRKRLNNRHLLFWFINENHYERIGF